jgi:hypothetical protein
MRPFWDLLESADQLGLRTLARLDAWRGLPSLLERSKRETAEVRPPQRVIEYGK